MLSLRDLQRGFRRALLDGDEALLAGLIAADGWSATERLDVHRNNVRSSLTGVLRDTFPVVCRLVDERFFAYTASEFIRLRPPDRACLVDYGAQFAAFLASFAPCRDLVYLPDVARLEWSLHRAANAPDGPPLHQDALRLVRPEEAPRLRFGFRPSYSYLSSPWPIDRIWRANRPQAAGSETIDLNAGVSQVEIRRHRGVVEMRTLLSTTFTFRDALFAGQTLEAALDSALAVDGNFEPAQALAGLFIDEAIRDWTLKGGSP